MRICLNFTGCCSWKLESTYSREVAEKQKEQKSIYKDSSLKVTYRILEGRTRSLSFSSAPFDAIWERLSFNQEAALIAEYYEIQQLGNAEYKEYTSFVW